MTLCEMLANNSFANIHKSGTYTMARRSSSSEPSAGTEVGSKSCYHRLVRIFGMPHGVIFVFYLVRI